MVNKEYENLARSVLVNCDMLNKLPVNLSEIARMNHIDIYYVELPEDVSGAIKYDKNTNRFKILIKDSLSRTRQRFTLAHELAHFFLEKELLKNRKLHIDTLYRKDSVSEANIDYFAGALLMDRDIIKELYDISPSVLALSQVFAVSESAMKVRLNILGLK